MVVWIDMLPTDGRLAVRLSSRLFNSLPQVSQFYDPGRIVGREVAKALGCEGYTAWDIYLFYPSGLLWNEWVPEPVEWYHQLGDDPWADAGHYRWADALPPALGQAAQRLK